MDCLMVIIVLFQGNLNPTTMKSNNIETKQEGSLSLIQNVQETEEALEEMKKQSAETQLVA